MLALIPIFGLIVWRNTHVKNLLFAGWTPIALAMVISSLAGILLEAYVEQYKGVALLTPVLIGLAGNLGSIYASRISTCLHSETKEDYKVVEYTLMAMNIPVQVVFMVIIWAFGMGQLQYNIWFFLSYFIISMICVSFFLFPYFSLYLLNYIDLDLSQDWKNYVFGILENGL